MLIKNISQNILYITRIEKKSKFSLDIINHPSPVASLKVFLTQLTIFTLTALHISISRIIWFRVDYVQALYDLYTVYSYSRG